MSRTWLLRLLLLAAFVGLLAAAFAWLPLREIHEAFLQQVEGLGVWGPVALGASYIPSCILMVPGSIISLGAGTLFGVVTGTIAVSIGSTLGAAAAFLVGRTVARRWVEERWGRSPTFRALDQAVAEQGFKVVLLVRLSPVFPFNVLNYAFSLTRVSFRDYALASWIGMFPGTVLYVYLGSSVSTLSDLFAGRPSAGTGFWVAGLVATVVATAYVTRLARRALGRALAAPPDEPVARAENENHG
jgi:uncharacterized membrane protein YdjX (TVP38/TMEM64 family)